MVTRIVIAGAGGFGREVHAWLETSPLYRAEAGIESVVFINDTELTGHTPAPIVSTITGYSPRPDDLVICAIGSPASRRAVVEQLSQRGARFATLVHDTVVLGADVSIGTGCVICPGAIITSNITIGAQVHVNINCSIGHDVTIGEYVTISPACNLMGNVSVGSDAFLGTAVTVVPGRSIGTGAILGAGSVVVKDIASGITAFGNPARPR